MPKPVRVIPAILTEDPQSLKSMLAQVEAFTDYVQIDIMDGRFVPSKSITWKQIAENKPRIIWEAHLMVERPEKHLSGFKEAGASKAIFHFEAADPETVIAAARKLDMAVGLAVNPETPVSAVSPLLDKIDSLLLLSVHPGFYGASFIPEVLDKIADLRRISPDLRIGIDGGIKESNISLIAVKGVDEIFVGSAIFLQPDPASSYRKLLSLANR
ncbi:MAG: ribulose-phosphate 3-epimerase [Dehalococcoidales bacterium]|nr:ribulose-phosphate 3-epimerase [Dehalococcoidales bacterium]